MQGTWVLSLGGEHPLGKEMATYSSIPVWRNPWTEEPGGLQPMGLQRVRHDWATKQQQQQGTRVQVLQLRKRSPVPQLRPSAAEINTLKRVQAPFLKKKDAVCLPFVGSSILEPAEFSPEPTVGRKMLSQQGSLKTWVHMGRGPGEKGTQRRKWGKFSVVFLTCFCWRWCVNISVNLWRWAVKSKGKITKEPSKNLFSCCFRMWSHEYFLLYTQCVDSLLFSSCWNDVEGFKELSHLKAFPNIFHYVFTKAVLALCLLFNSHIFMW